MGESTVGARVPRRLPKAAEVLAEELRGRILSRSLPAGTPLTTEAELIDEHGFSRGTVREALRLLEVEGLITIRRGPRGGVSVARPDPSQVSKTLSLLFTLDETTLSDFFEFRKLIEPHAARLAAGSPKQPERDRLATSMAEGHDDAAKAANFHRVLAECVDNEIVRVILIALYDILDRHVRQEVLHERDMSAVADVHRRIARAIRDGRPEVAERGMRKHLEAFEQLLREQGRLDQAIISRSRWNT